jgi:hypothetical protein
MCKSDKPPGNEGEAEQRAQRREDQRVPPRESRQSDRA